MTVQVTMDTGLIHIWGQKEQGGLRVSSLKTVAQSDPSELFLKLQMKVAAVL